MNFIKSYELHLSIWCIIKDKVAQNELQEIKSFLGEDLVDQCEELREEIKTLLEINNQLSNERSSGDVNNFLPEPPEVRERLLKEIQFFVSSIRERSKAQGRDPDYLLTGRSKDIVDYAYESGNSSRPLTSETNSTTSRSSFRATPTSDRTNINLLSEKFNYMDFEEVKTNLKQSLQDEVNHLREDIEKIQLGICGENQSIDRELNLFPTSSRSICPSISELRTERRELERLLIQETTRPSTSSSQISTASSRSSINGIQFNGPAKQKKQLFNISSNPKEHKPITSFNSQTQSPTKLKPLPETVANTSSSITHVDSPLDLGLPDSEMLSLDHISLEQDFLVTNNENTQTRQQHTPIIFSKSLSNRSPLSSGDSSPRHNISSPKDSFKSLTIDNNNNNNNNNLASSSIPSYPKVNVRTTVKYNAAQKFRQKILQNRKETLFN